MAQMIQKDHRGIDYGVLFFLSAHSTLLKNLGMIQAFSSQHHFALRSFHEEDNLLMQTQPFERVPGCPLSFHQC